jgi:hypothetical protein
MGERISGKEFVENRKFKMTATGPYSMKKLHGDHTGLALDLNFLGPIWLKGVILF